MAGKFQKKQRPSLLPYAAALIALALLLACAVYFGPKLLRQSEPTPEASAPSQSTDASEPPAETQPSETNSETAPETEPPTNPPEDTSWSLVLVNASHPLPENWQIELTDLRYGEQVDSRMYPYLQAMFDACRADGLLPMVNSSYRSTADQQRIMDNYISDYLEQGYSEADAKAEAEKWVAIPGTSEHQLGLAVDIDSDDLTLCSNESVWNWMKEHCAEYGFILRYPEGKEDITGISHEPWHFRYVGKEAATEIMTQGICLEEYLNH